MDNIHLTLPISKILADLIRSHSKWREIIFMGCFGGSVRDLVELALDNSESVRFRPEGKNSKGELFRGVICFSGHGYGYVVFDFPLRHRAKRASGLL